MNKISAKPMYQQGNVWLKIALLLYVFLFLYAPTISSLVKQWARRDDYSHGFLIPFIFLYLIWHQREKLRYIPITTNITRGIIIILLAGFMLLIGNTGSVIMVQELSLIVMIYGIVLLLFGTEYLAALALSISYLFFMVPGIIDPLLTNFNYPFQIFSAKAAATLLNAVNVPVTNKATFLELPNIVLEVAEECSGIRYLISILAIAVPLAYITQRKMRRRVILIGSALFIGIIMNPIRIAFVGIWTYMGGDPVHGPSHMFQGLFVAQAGYIVFFALTLIMSQKNTYATALSLKTKAEPQAVAEIDGKKFHAGLMAMIALLLLFQAILYFLSPVPVPLNNSLSKLPLTIGNWRGTELDRAEDLFSLPGADEKLHRIYRNADGKEITFHVNYFAYQNQDKELISYRHQRLYNKTREIVLPATSKDNVKINKAVLDYGRKKTIIFYWYDVKGRIVASRNLAKLLTATDGLMNRKTNGAIIIVSRNTEDMETAKTPTMDEMQFIQDVMTAVSGHMSTYEPNSSSYSI